MPRQNSNFHFIKERTEILVDMQHYEMKTRLLDWSLSPLVALYFAVAEDLDDSCENSKVYIFNSWKYQNNFKRTSDSHAMHVLGRALLSDRKHYDIKDILKGEFYGNYLEKNDLKYPYPFIAKYGNPRIIQQHGCFTIHGRCRSPLEHIAKFRGDEGIMFEIEIPYDKRSAIKKELSMLFVNHYSLFPDHSGMAHHLRTSSIYDICK